MNGLNELYGNYGNLGQSLQECRAIEFGIFTLASGKKSRYYVDIKRASTKPKILRMMSSQITRLMKINGLEADYIACVELGGVPIGTAVSLETELPLLIIRKNQKDHGIANRVIGDYKEKKTALFVEDVVTTGGSSSEAIKLLKNNGLSVNNAICIVDREEGGEETLSKIGVTLTPVMKIRDLLKK